MRVLCARGSEQFIERLVFSQEELGCLKFCERTIYKWLWFIADIDGLTLTSALFCDVFIATRLIPLDFQQIKLIDLQNRKKKKKKEEKRRYFR